MHASMTLAHQHRFVLLMMRTTLHEKQAKTNEESTRYRKRREVAGKKRGKREGGNTHTHEKDVVGAPHPPHPNNKKINEQKQRRTEIPSHMLG